MMAATEPLANWAISNIGPPEIFALVFFGLAVASSVGGRTLWKGWISVLLRFADSYNWPGPRGRNQSL